MRWRKLGRLFKAAGQRSWMQSHCSMPFAEPRGGGLFRIWFAPRDGRNRSHAAWLEIDIRKPRDILRIADEPAIAPGAAGRFDHSGAAASCLVPHETGQRLYYIGWSLDGPDPFHIAIGLAVAPDPDAPFTRHSDDPILDRSPADPVMVSTPYVLPTDDGWRMWYLSVTDWPNRDWQPNYNIRQATSDDGITWRTDPTPCVDVIHPSEVAIARPMVVRDGAMWRMWFSHRGAEYHYRVGYAESRDGRRWVRKDAQAGIDVSESGWDSEMTAYPFVFDYDGERYMLYAGNGYGREGMGLAILEQD